MRRSSSRRNRDREGGEDGGAAAGYGFDGEVNDAAATSTRRFGRVRVASTVHAPAGEGGPGGRAELSITGKGPRPDGARLSIEAAPFSGSAGFKKRPGAPATWLGSLAVRIPGEGTLPPAGSEFESVICGLESVGSQRACERTVAPPHLAR